jgi:DNA (cytosine-5)-methyltransferase 3A
MGDVTKWREWPIEWAAVDLILSGSPCQDLSIAGNYIHNSRDGLSGKKSSLFWIFIDILNHVKAERKKAGKPEALFLQENVGSAHKKDVGIMSRAMGVYPARLNSRRVTAQLRDRYYWTNIRTRQEMFDLVSDIPAPKDRKIMFKDIITDGYVDRKKARAVLESESRLNTDLSRLYKRYSKFGNIVYTDMPVARGGKLIFEFKGDNIRPLNKTELCLLQGFPGDYCDILDRNDAASLLGDGWTLPIIEHIFQYIKL